MILILLFGMLLAAGLFLILADVFSLPRIATNRAMITATREQKEKGNNLEAVLNGWTVVLAKYIPMDEYKKHRLQNTLHAAGMKDSGRVRSICLVKVWSCGAGSDSLSFDIAITCTGSIVSCNTDLF